MLTKENYKEGFLVDDELMAGVAPESKTDEKPEKEPKTSDNSRFFAYVIRTDTGQHLGAQQYDSLDAALDALNSIPRSWKYESVHECKGQCKNGGHCGQENVPGVCPKSKFLKK